MHCYHTHGNGWDEPTSPGPVEFLSALVEELCGIPAAWVVEEKSGDTVFRTVRGRCGAPQRGFRWTIRGLADDASVYARSFTDHNVPGLSLDWDTEWFKSGYVYRFHHRELAVEFGGADAESRFHDVWRRVFDRPPVLSAGN
jgi:hypothetical protein